MNSGSAETRRAILVSLLKAPSTGQSPVRCVSLGVMNIMVYSRIAQLWIEAMRKLISDFALESVNEDLLRRVRQRIMDRADSWPIQNALDSDDFSTLAGTHDMLLHRHVDSFDVPRIAQALDRLGLRLLSFELRPGQAAASLYALLVGVRNQAQALLERLEMRGVYVPNDQQREVVRLLYVATRNQVKALEATLSP
jgi:hypothetical protein